MRKNMLRCVHQLCLIKYTCQKKLYFYNMFAGDRRAFDNGRLVPGWTCWWWYRMFPHWSKGKWKHASNCKLCFSRYQIFDDVYMLDECDRNETTNFSSMCEVLALVLLMTSSHSRFPDTFSFRRSWGHKTLAWPVVHSWYATCTLGIEIGMQVYLDTQTISIAQTQDLPIHLKAKDSKTLLPGVSMPTS